MKAPFPYFGGKRLIADLVWERFGDVGHYVEPFAGSLAVLLARPEHHKRRSETVNDADGLLVNFWRATALRPDEVADHADWPVTELDLHARHEWLIGKRDEITERLRSDPDWCDPKAAGWWVWGISAWIGQGWGVKTSRQIPHLGGGSGIHRSTSTRRAAITRVAERVSRLRVTCGDWSRVVTPAVLLSGTGSHTGVFLDPPYAGERNQAYAVDEPNVAADITRWCEEHGDNPRLRIAVCGYGEHDRLVDLGWERVEWKAQGGYGNQSNGLGRVNAERETILFSPHCLGNDNPFDMG